MKYSAIIFYHKNIDNDIGFIFKNFLLYCKLQNLYSGMKRIYIML